MELLNCKEKPAPIHIATGNIIQINSGVRKNMGTLPTAVNIIPAKNCFYLEYLVPIFSSNKLALILATYSTNGITANYHGVYLTKSFGSETPPA